MDISQKKINKILHCSSELEEQDVHKAKALDFMPKMLVTAAMPHRDPKGSYQANQFFPFSYVFQSQGA